MFVFVFRIDYIFKARGDEIKRRSMKVFRYSIIMKIMIKNCLRWREGRRFRRPRVPVAKGTCQFGVSLVHVQTLDNCPAAIYVYIYIYSTGSGGLNTDANKM